MILIIKLKVVTKNLFIDPSDYKVVVIPKYALKAKTKTTIKPKSVIRIKTPLNIISIALQNERERN